MRGRFGARYELRIGNTVTGQRSSAGILSALSAGLLADVLFDVRGALNVLANSSATALESELSSVFEQRRLEIRAAFSLFLVAQIKWIYAVWPGDTASAGTCETIGGWVDLVGRCLIMSTLVLVWRGCTGAAEVVVGSGTVFQQGEFAYGALLFSRSYFPLILGLLCMATGCLLVFAGVNRTR